MRRKITLFLLVMILGVLPAGFAFAAETPVYGGVARWHATANPPMLDPHMATDTTSARVYILMFDTLVTNSDDGQKILPWLAESWSASADGKVWTFKLRKGVRFHKNTEGGKADRQRRTRSYRPGLEMVFRAHGPRQIPPRLLHQRS